jgi:DNA polymerase III gamma/tau subunit
MILNIAKKKNITITSNAIEELLKKINSSIYTIENFFDKMELMNIYEITTNIVKKNYNIFDYNIFNIYFSNIINNNLKEANKILFNLYDDGYDVSDIYFLLYDFIKQENKEEYYILISLICYYINENYNGNYNKIFLIFLTYDIKKII